MKEAKGRSASPPAGGKRTDKRGRIGFLAWLGDVRDFYAIGQPKESAADAKSWIPKPTSEHENVISIGIQFFIKAVHDMINHVHTYPRLESKEY
jgi:hypothetical protein